MKPLKSLMLGISLALMMGCSNPVKPPPLPVPDCPSYRKLTSDELSLLSRCTPDKKLCLIHRAALLKLLHNHQESVSCIKEHQAIIGSTH